MCEYCEEGWFIDSGKPSSAEDINIWIGRDKRLRAFCSHGYDEYWSDIKINYCPMCGRKLENVD